MENVRRRAWLSWASVSLLALLCGGLAVLQYRWIGEITSAERTRLAEALYTRLATLSRSFNEEMTGAFAALLPPSADVERLGPETAYSTQYATWRTSHPHLFRRVALAEVENRSLRLMNLDLDTARFTPADWPAEWSALHEQLDQRLEGFPMPVARVNPSLFEFPRFRAQREDVRSGEQEWLIVELDLDYMRSTAMPELLQRYLAEGGRLQYEAEVVASADPSQVIYASTPNHRHQYEGKADASIELLSVRPVGFGGRGGRGGDGGRGGPPGRGFERRREPGEGERQPMPRDHMMEARGPGGPGGPPDGMPGRWRLLVRHQAGSLEALVAQTRRRNLAISGAVLLLILATVGMMVRFSRQAEQLARLQMNFVAGVSHELRTPLTVIRTAAFNLRGKLAARPDQVERYGALIQAESERLGNLVEQVLQFASAQAGHAIRAREPVAVENLIEESIRSSRVRLGGDRLVIERHIDDGLPPVMADQMAMTHALQNLIDNALKYGTEASNWIGVFAKAVEDKAGAYVEIRIADRGPGIPLDEQERVFDPFFRGRRAVEDQVHGTGLGLNLVKKIVEAHGGSIRIQSQPMEGTEFIIRVPAAPPEFRDEFAHSVS